MKAFIILRDRVTYARQCADALTAAGQEVVVVDQGSTWGPAVEWLEHCERKGTLVLRHGHGDPQSVFSWEPFQRAAGDGRYIVTDPDTVPADTCPADYPQVLSGLLDEYPEVAKVGLGLRLDAITENYPHREGILSSEEKFWQSPARDGVYYAAVDTTFAVYRGGFFFTISNALRTGSPYLAEHLPWYEDWDNLTEEISYYYAHAAPGISHSAPFCGCTACEQLSR